MNRIILFGPPGSGKGTQAELLVKKKGFIHLSTGDLLRSEISLKTEFGIKVREYIDNGLLVPDELITKYILGYVRHNDLYKKKVCFDGFPRRVSQAEALERVMAENGSSLDAALMIDVDENIIIERLSNRLTCSNCKKVLPGDYEDENCPDCHHTLIKRSDDNIEVIKKRIDVYKNETAVLFQYFKESNKLVVVNGNAPVNTVLARIEEILGD